MQWVVGETDEHTTRWFKVAKEGPTQVYGSETIKVLQDTGPDPIISSQASTAPPGTVEPPSSSGKVASWIKPEHVDPFLLCTSLYDTPLVGSGPYRILPEYTQVRTCTWSTIDGRYFVGCRGTDINGKYWYADLHDDAILAGLNEFGTADTTLTEQVVVVMNDLIQKGIPPTNIMLGGHSLGGNTALVTAAKYGSYACSFNGAGTVVNTNYIGPGPEKATHYHIVGCWISTHVALSAAEVIRVDKGASFGLGLGYAHSTDRFLAGEGQIGFLTAEEEQSRIVKWILGRSFTVWSLIPVVGMFFSTTSAYLLLLFTKNPIPGSNLSWYTEAVNINHTWAQTEKEKEFGHELVDWYKHLTTPTPTSVVIK